MCAPLHNLSVRISNPCICRINDLGLHNLLRRRQQLSGPFGHILLARFHDHIPLLWYIYSAFAPLDLYRWSNIVLLSTRPDEAIWKA